MSLRERTHAAYFAPEAKGSVAVEKQLSINDNDRPRSAFEAAIEQIRSEYTEAQAMHQEANKQLTVLDNDIRLIWQELEGLGVATAESAPLAAECVELQTEYAALTRTAGELAHKMDQLKFAYEPFQAVQSGLEAMQSSSDETMRLRKQEQLLMAEAELLRTQWATHEAEAAQTEAWLDREEERLAATQNAVFEDLQRVKDERDGHFLHRGAASDPRYAHVPEYQQWAQYFKQADGWVSAKEEEKANLTAEREAIQTRRQTLKTAGQQILAKYDSCMEGQLDVLRQIAEAEQVWTAAQDQYRQGKASASEVMQSRDIFKPAA